MPIAPEIRARTANIERVFGVSLIPNITVCCRINLGLKKARIKLR